jgi:hypothetical protein
MIDIAVVVPGSLTMVVMYVKWSKECTYGSVQTSSVFTKHCLGPSLLMGIRVPAGNAK